VRDYVGMMRKDTIMFVAFLLTVSFLVLLTVGIADNEDSNWWAAWGQWVGGVGSVAAAAIAVGIAVEGWRRSDALAEKQARRVEEVQQQELASKVGVWLNRPDQSTYEVVYMNSGELPVYEAMAVARLNDDLQVHCPLGSLNPVSAPTARNDATGLVTLLVEREAERLAGERLTLDYGNPQGNPKVVRHIRALLTGVQFQVQFRDGNGLRWRREFTGELSRVD
jgi:hypothetical protein